ncbi:MAG TPA: response regulator transcription factor [Acidimicrobiales bacterium]|nr:response regulator transcription factor [Acidimicrobiales bacterium]
MAEPLPPRVLVCDDHPLFRRGVVTSLEDGGVDVVAEAADGVEAVELAMAHAPDVVLMDLRMPRAGGVEATAELRRLRPDARIVVLTVGDDLDELADAIRAGARGWLRKEESADQLLDAVAEVAAGGCRVPGPLAARVRSELARVAETRPEALTARRDALLAHLVDGGSVASGASALGLPYLTARNELRVALEWVQRAAAAAIPRPGG